MSERRVDGRRGALLAVLALAASLRAGPATAQVNSETLRADPFRSGWGGSVDLTLSLLKGNVDFLDAGGAGRVQHQTLFPTTEGEVPFLKERLFLAGSVRFAEKNGATFVNQSFLHVRWTRMWRPRLGGDLFLQSQQNEFLKLERRRLAGLGLRAELVHRRHVLVVAGAGGMLESERIDVAPGADDPRDTTTGRATSYLSFRLDPLAGELLFQVTGYFQPRLADLADYRILGEVEVQARAGKKLSLGVVFTAVRDSQPPTGIDPVDLRLANTLRVTF